MLISEDGYYKLKEEQARLSRRNELEKKHQEGIFFLSLVYSYVID